jgi:hypothetical protein
MPGVMPGAGAVAPFRSNPLIATSYTLARGADTAADTAAAALLKPRRSCRTLRHE